MEQTKLNYQNLDTLQKNNINPQNFEQIGSDQVITDILSKLKFLSKIKVGEKINCRFYFVRDNNSLIQRFLRTIRNFSAENSENKTSTLEFINDIINKTINLICLYKTNGNPFSQQISELLIENLKESKNGILNLVKTYEDDRIFVSKLESFIDGFELKLLNI